jgi:hypothetical protein
MTAQTTESNYTIEVDTFQPRRWYRIIENFSDASIYQTYDYGAVRWGAENLSHLVVSYQRKIVAAIQLRIIRIPIINIGIAYTYYGPMWQPRDLEKNIDYLRTVLQAIKTEYAFKRKLLLRIRPRGFEELDGDMKNVLREEGFKLTAGLFQNKQRTIILDLQPSVEDLRRQLRKKWRQTLSRAEKNSLNLVERYDSTLFKTFGSLFSETIRLKKFKPGSDVNEFAEVQELLPDAHKMRITICNADGKAVAGSVCAALGDTVVGLLSASNEKGRRKQAYYLLQWDEIVWAKSAGKKYYDLGGINKEINPGVYRFKTGLRGQELSFLGVFDFCKNKPVFWIILFFEYLVIMYNQLLDRFHKLKNDMST